MQRVHTTMHPPLVTATPYFLCSLVSYHITCRILSVTGVHTLYKCDSLSSHCQIHTHYYWHLPFYPGFDHLENNYKCDQIFQKRSYTRTVSRHTFHCHLLPTSMHQQHMCLLLLKVKVCFHQGLFSSLSGIHKCLGSL